ASRNWRDGQASQQTMDRNSRPLNEQVESAQFSHQVRSIHDGKELSPTTRTLRPRLSPAFVSWLMGFPTWWMNIGLTSYGSQEMQSYLCKQRLLLECLLGDFRSAGGS